MWEDDGDGGAQLLKTGMERVEAAVAPGNREGG